jgi:hypothetical protein
MKRLMSAVATLLVIAPVALFAVFLWFNWGRPVLLPGDDPRIIRLLLPLNRAVETGVPEALGGAFAFGVLMGVLATALSVATRSQAWRGTLEQLERDKLRLAAANRALQAALPTLREGFDAAIGADQPAVADTPLDHGDAVAEPVDLQQLALEDARSRRREG